MKNVVTLLAIVGTCASAALAQNIESRTLAGPFNLSGTGAGTLANTSLTGLDAGVPYVPARIGISGTLQTVLASSLPNQVLIYLTGPTGEEFSLQPTANATAGGTTVTFSRSVALPVDVTSVAGAWSLRMVDTVNSGIGTDAVLSDLTFFTTNDALTADRTYSPLPLGPQSDSLTAPGNVARWIKITVPAIDAANGSFLDAITTSGGDTEIGFYGNDGTLIANDDDAGPGLFSAVSFGTGGLSGEGRGGQSGATLAAGTYWVALINYNAAFSSPFTITTTAGAADTTIGYTIERGTVTEVTTADNTINPLPAGATTVSATVPDNGAYWIKFTTPRNYLFAEGKYLNITCADGDIAVYNDGASGTRRALNTAAVTFGTNTVTGNAAANGDLNAGTYWVAVASNGAFFSPTIRYSSSALPGLTTDVTFTDATYVAPPDLPAPTGTIAVGTLGNGVYENTSDYAITEFKWFSFTLPVAAPAGGDKFVDIWTVADAYLGTNTFQNDTQIGLYKANGIFVAGDDQSGGNNLSALTYGDTANVRATGDINTALLNGNDGGLAAGNYYLAVGGWIMTFGADLNVTSTGDDAGSVTVKIGSNFAPTCTCCNLSNVAGPNQSTTPDDVLTADDIIVFLGWFFANDPRANVAGANQSTIPDNVLTADDIIVFLGRYFAGC